MLPGIVAETKNGKAKSRNLNDAVFVNVCIISPPGIVIKLILFSDAAMQI
jgi:hypothetical protein